MSPSTILTVGSLVRDLIYVNDEETGRTHFICARGGGAPWNALANASLNGARTSAVCVGGADSAARVCVDDLRKAGVSVEIERFVRGKSTRSLHELLSRRSVEAGAPRHEFSTVCPVCGQKTYLQGTARVSEQLMDDCEKMCRKLVEDGLLIHLDGLDETRLTRLKRLRSEGAVLSVDLGRSTGLFRMRQLGLMDRLKGIDILFVHSKVIPELKRVAGAKGESDLLNKIEGRLLVITRGEKGLDYWIRVGSETVEDHQHASANRHLVDTAGAGDALIGFFLAQISREGRGHFDDLLGSPEGVSKALRKAQDWAARKCGYLGARGHIAGIDGQTWSWDERRGLVPTVGSTSDLRLANLGKTKCAACGWDLDIRERQALSAAVRFKQNVLALPSKVEKAWGFRSSCDWTALRSFRSPGYVVGTGGSFVVATFLAQLLSFTTRSLVVPIRPFDYVRTALTEHFAIFVSNTGKTSDVAQAIQYAVDREVPQAVLVTGAQPEDIRVPLRPKMDKLLSTRTDGERGFLSVAGAIVPCFMSLACLDPDLWKSDKGFLLFNRLYDDAKRSVGKVFGAFEAGKPPRITGNPVLILGGGLAWPAMLDLESKMVEGNLGHPQVSEMKDYSHGRFVSSIDKKGTAVVCGMPDDLSYRTFLVDRLEPRLKVLELTTERSGPVGALDLLLQSEHLLQMISEREGVDISRPPVPTTGLELYRYKDLLGSIQTDDGSSRRSSRAMELAKYLSE